MKSDEYRQIIRTISRNIIRKNVPGLKGQVLEETVNLIAKSVHARMYGANVDGVDSPIWSIDRNGSARIEKALAAHPDGCKSSSKLNPRVQPNKDAKDLLNE